MLKNILNIPALLILTCCGTLPYQPVLPETREIRTPEVNVETEVRLGEAMLNSGRLGTIAAFRLQNDVRIFDAVVKAGPYHQIGIRDSNRVYGPEGGNGTGIVGAMSGMASDAKVYIDDTSGFICFMGYYSTRFCSDEVRPNVSTVEIFTTDSFQQELIYTGKIGDRIRFTYREFMNRMAREAFTVDVEYDLSQSNVISYQGATIEIVSATNQIIKYKVLEHFD